MSGRATSKSRRATGWKRAISIVGLIVVLASLASHAAGPRVLPDGQVPHDARLQPLKDLNGYFPFDPPKTKEAWAVQSERLRMRILVSQGLWPMPQPTPLNAVVHGLIDQGDYTIEKAYFESFPGFFVTGNLYRPKNGDGKAPGVLCPHGHWSEGRFYDAGEKNVLWDIVRGGERFENGGRSPMQSRCVQLARMGCVVFHYDMIGYADSQQISFQLAHKFAKQRPEMNAAENWGLFSPQAESRLQSVMGLQTYNSLRALDFITSLPDVDSHRIAVTGASGGGTQTFMASAVDPRVTVSIPAVMVSTAMQGGCTCENACLLRVEAGNVDYAGLFAPKPLCLLAADDWTKEMPTKGFPELQQLYQLLGSPKLVELHALTHFKHNYNYVNRASMYHWVNEHLELGLSEPIVEEDYERLSGKELTVWDDQHPQPPGGDDFERDLLRYWTQDTREQLDALKPVDAESFAKYKATVGAGIDVVIGRHLPSDRDVAFVETTRQAFDGGEIVCGLLRNTPRDEELPLIQLVPSQKSNKTAIWLTPLGKAGLFDEQGRPLRAVRQLLRAGVAVIGVDLLYQGEFLADGKPLEETGRVDNPREAAAYTFGYNHSVFAQRTHDVLSVIQFAKFGREESSKVFLLATEGAGPWAAAARAVAAGAVDRAAIWTGGFRFGAVTAIHSPDFLPGGAKYDDLPGMLAVAAPGPLWLAGESEPSAFVVAAAYAAADAQAKFRFVEKDAASPESAVAWLLAE